MNWYAKTALQSLAAGVGGAIFLAGSIAVMMLIIDEVVWRLVFGFAWVGFIGSVAGTAIGASIFSDKSPFHK